MPNHDDLPSGPLPPPTPEEFRSFRTSLRIQAIEAALMCIVGALDRALPPGTVRELLTRLQIRHSQMRIPGGLPPEQHDLITAESQEAVDTLFDLLKTQLSHKS